MWAKSGTRLQAHTLGLSGADSLVGEASRRSQETRPGTNIPTVQEPGLNTSVRISDDELAVSVNRILSCDRRTTDAISNAFVERSNFFKRRKCSDLSKECKP